jgi:enoyl-CoA hydratase/carnithine racemase
MYRGTQKTLKRSISSLQLRQWKHFQEVKVNADGVAEVKIDSVGNKNLVTNRLLNELSRLWEQQIDNNKAIKAVVFSADKPGCFVAGSDLKEVAAYDKKLAEYSSLQGQRLFRKLRKSNLPLVAAIDGLCLGSGLEWAMNCDYRIASDSSDTLLGFPEVSFGLIPWFGGTQKLPPLVGLKESVNMLTTGETVSAHQAKHIGLVDDVVSPSKLQSIAIARAKELADKTLNAKKPKRFRQFLDRTYPGRAILLRQARKRAKKSGCLKSRLVIIDCVEKLYTSVLNPRDAYSYEAMQFARLVASDESRSLAALLKENRKQEIWG